MKLNKVISAGILIGSLSLSTYFLTFADSLQEKNIDSGINTSSISREVETTIEPLTETEVIVGPGVNISQTSKENKTEYVYTTDRVNIRYTADINSEILVTAAAGTKLYKVESNTIEGWDTIEINNNDYYISNKYITVEIPEIVADSIEQQIENNTISAIDLRYMSAIIYAEAGNQCQAGKQAVGIVVMNRVLSKVYKNTVYDVIYEPYQFSPVRNGSLKKALSLYDNGKISEDIIEAAKYALKGNTVIYYNNQYYDLAGYLYFSRYVSGCRLKIQDHMFK